MSKALSYQLIKTDSRTKARRGRITTPHGTIETPVFMPVGTQATVKAMKPEDVAAQGAEIILSNTYHLYLRPGSDIVREAGGLHKFMNWNKPILTDSGGFQVFSLGKMRKITEEGVKFQSYIDGSRHMMRPEDSIQVQNDLGSDIIMAFDECVSYPSERRYVEASYKRTTRWLERCVKYHKNPDKQALFGIMQGGMFKDMRAESAKEITQFDLPGYAIGGLSVGEPKEIMLDILDDCVDYLPSDRPRYLMGVGTPDYLFEGVERGVDMFDCVMPTRNGRNAMLFTYNGTMNMRNKKWEQDFSPIDPDGCDIDCLHSKAYLHHLFKAQELLAMQIASIHNLAFYLRLVTDARQHIEQGDFVQWKRSVIDNLGRRI